MTPPEDSPTENAPTEDGPSAAAATDAAADRDDEPEPTSADAAESSDYRVGRRFRVVDGLPGVGPDGEREPAAVDAEGTEWRVVATDDEEGLVRFDEGEWYRLDEIERLVDEGSLEPLDSDGESPPTLAAGARTYWLEPGLKFVADASFAQSHLSGTSEEPVEFVVVDVDDGDVRVAERTDDGYVPTNRAMSLSTLERGTELSELDCVGPASVEEREAAVEAAD